MKKYLLLLLPAIVILNSCTKIPGTFVGTSGGTTTNTATSGTYQPLTANSTWTYRIDLSSIGFAYVDTSTITMSAKTYTLNGKQYQQDYGVQKGYPSIIDTGYYYATNHDYSLMQTLSGPGGSTYAFEMLYLKDNLAVGGTWTASTTATSTLNAIQLTGKIMETGISKTVQGKVYNNVIHTSIQIAITIQGTAVNASYEIYVAQNIGIIHLEENSYGLTIPEDLIAYNIK